MLAGWTHGAELRGHDRISVAHAGQLSRTPGDAVAAYRIIARHARANWPFKCGRRSGRARYLVCPVACTAAIYV